MESIALTRTIPFHSHNATPFRPLQRSSTQLRLSNPDIFPPLFLNVSSRNFFLYRHHCSKSSDSGGEPAPQPEDGPFFATMLRRWDVPWKWHSFLLTILSCYLSFRAQYIRYQVVSGLDAQFMLILAENSLKSFVTLNLIYNLHLSSPLSDDLFRFDWREPFNPRKGWLLWAALGLVVFEIGSKVINAIVLTYYYGYRMRPPNIDAFILMPCPDVHTKISLACKLALLSVLGPFTEEYVFRGFLMVGLTKWVPTSVAVLLSSTLFALAHSPPWRIPKIFVLGFVMGCTYAQTRNLLTPFMIHALHNTRVLWIETHK